MLEHGRYLAYGYGWLIMSKLQPARILDDFGTFSLKHYLNKKSNYSSFY